MTKHWIAQAQAWLKASREPVPHEINELDWKAYLSGDKERLIEHLISFANHPNNGYLVSVDQEQVEGIIARLTNIGRDECCRSNFSS